MTIPDEAYHAALNAFAEADSREDALMKALTASLPFLQGVKPGSLVNDANIISSDMPHTVVKKLDAAYETRILSAIEAGETIETYYARQIEWSKKTFGPALRTLGILDHIRKELKEIEAEPHDLSEWIDVVILAMDGFWRHGGSVNDIMPRLLAKQQKNMARDWPDWRNMSEDSSIEHDRTKDAAPSPRAQALEEAVRNLIANRFDHYKARNGKLCSIEGDDGEKCWIVSFDDMAELESALSSQPVADGWLPIETAPKDGESVEVYDSFITGKDGFAQVIARHDKEHGWHVAASVVGGIYIKLTNPTHWRPLPASPGASE